MAGTEVYLIFGKTKTGDFHNFTWIRETRYALENGKWNTECRTFQSASE
jgi:hypothetical protein